MFPLMSMVFLGSLLFVDTAWEQKPSFCGKSVCPEYTVVHSGSGFEKRRYEAATWINATAFGDYEQASSTTYFKLKDYLEGNNAEKRLINMAVPSVTMMFPINETNVLGVFTKFFFIPTTPSSPAPQPKDVSISISKVPPKELYIRQIEGKVPTITDWVKHSQDLAKAINDTSKYYPSFFFAAVYNAPFETGKLHNEVWFYAMDDPKV